MNTATIITLVTLVLYQIALLGIGFWAKGRTKTMSDYFLGGRTLGPWVSGLSYAASSSSAWVLLGLSGFFFAIGPLALWILPGVWLGYVVVWLVIGPSLRRAAATHDLITLTDFLVIGITGKMRKTITALAAGFILFCFSLYVASQFQGAGNAFASSFGLSMGASVLIGAGVVLAYTWVGGFWAVSVTDALQAVLMIVVAVVLAVLALVLQGSPQAIWSSASANPAAISPQGIAAFGFVIGCLGIGIGPVGQPQLLNRLMAIRSGRDIKTGFAIAITWSVIVFSSMAVLGLCARSLLPATTPAEDVFFVFSHAALPPVLAGIVLAAVLSAILSTADSLLLAAGSAAAHDLGLAKKFVGKELLISRLVTLGISAIAVALTLFLPASIFSRVLFAWSAMGAAFGPTVLLRAIGHPPTSWGVLLSMVSGFALTILFYLQPDAPGDVLERVVPFVVALAIALGFRQQSKISNKNL
ncbi:Proline/sodium symporter PutP (TC 2.A.21.2.1) @ Propionate/sodium symporter [hydrothermal vent metagenome]|uniref:Proline/sodium symporter PutP (TC 2.A.21.2.1) @ Propionate/sodium symporter n=1 Tax=hydrothermal vent metagenome TaxID=652676 RepID=A0A3B0RUF9_9ZZZZ